MPADDQEPRGPGRPQLPGGPGRTQVCLGGDRLERARELARERGVKLADLLRQLVDRELEAQST